MGIRLGKNRVGREEDSAPNVSRAEERKNMVEGLRKRKILRSSAVEQAMLTVPRHFFVPSDLQDSAYQDTPLPIGMGQTISAPHMVAIMLETAELKRGMRVLEVGAGSGYQAAVMANVVAPEGHVYTVERLEGLVDRARSNVAKAGLSEHVTIFEGDGSVGIEEHAPYDRIFVTCGSPGLPPPLGDQLAEGGIMLVPEGELYIQTLVEYRKKGGELVKRKRDGVMFVPLIGKHGWSQG